MDYKIRLKNLRTDNDLTQKDLANELHMSQKNISDFEKGKTRLFFEYAIKIAEYFDVSLDYLAGITDEKGSFKGKKEKRS